MRLPLLSVLIVSLLAAGCGSDSSSSSDKKSSGAAPPAGASKTNKVDIKDFKYKPKTVEIEAGTKVSFTNQDTAKHTATSKPQGKFDSGDISKGQTKPVTFKKAGTFKYYCVYHAFMNGTVKVK